MPVFHFLIRARIRQCEVPAIGGYSPLLVLKLPAIFLGFVYILLMKFRKSPFDLSTSHHAHQELVKGLTTEFSGTTLALIEIAHWYENVFLLGWVYLFFAGNAIAGACAVFAVLFFLTLADNCFARLKWKPVQAIVTRRTNMKATGWFKWHHLNQVGFGGCDADSDRRGRP